MFDYAGHLIRVVAGKPWHLTGPVVKYRNTAWKTAMAAVVAHQWHPARHAPWNQEHRFHAYFRGIDLVRTDVAMHRDRKERMRFVLESGADAVIVATLYSCKSASGANNRGEIESSDT